MIGLYHDVGRYQEALADGARLLKELKKLDDKNLLVEVQLLESKTYHALSNLPKVGVSCPLATYPYAIKNQRKARNAPSRGHFVPKPLVVMIGKIF